MQTGTRQGEAGTGWVRGLKLDGLQRARLTKSNECRYWKSENGLTTKRVRAENIKRNSRCRESGSFLKPKVRKWKTGVDTNRIIGVPDNIKKYVR